MSCSARVDGCRLLDKGGGLSIILVGVWVRGERLRRWRREFFDMGTFGLEGCVVVAW